MRTERLGRRRQAESRFEGSVWDSNPGSSPGKPMGAFRKAWANACQKVGVSGLLFHDLRRTAVRNMIRAGIDKTVAKKISGHRTDAVFDRYNITSDEDIRDAMQKNEAYVSALSANSNLTALEQVG